MKYPYLAPLAYLLISCASQQNYSSGNLPADVKDFVEKRELCEHFSGEIPGVDSPEQDQLIDDANKSCASSDQNLERLKKKYRKNPSIMSIINGY